MTQVNDVTKHVTRLPHSRLEETHRSMKDTGYGILDTVTGL